MKQTIADAIEVSLKALQEQKILETEINYRIIIERARDERHGDFACNIAMMLAKQAKTNPRELAEKIISNLPDEAAISKVELAGPGFINFFVNAASRTDVIKTVLDQGADFGRVDVGANRKVLIEFVSSNPTGPLHVGHGRGAAFGMSLANILDFAGFQVDREYYVNDAGRQMSILATSLWLRYLAACGLEFQFPSNGYQGDYLIELATELHNKYEQKFIVKVAELFADVPADAPEGDKELHIDALCRNCEQLLGNDSYQIIFTTVLDEILAGIKSDLADFEVTYNSWFHERDLVSSGAFDEVIAKLKTKEFLYELDGALWFKSTMFGDEKDRVVIRENGITTYFGNDIAYHLNKINRGYDLLINVLGSDHHGYVPRVAAAIQALTGKAERLKTCLVQFAILYRGAERVQMSTRSGSFVSLRSLIDEVGTDAARFFYVMRKAEQHMDFDLELAKKRSNENPVYYIQYAHARICATFRQLDERKLNYDQDEGLANLALLQEANELKIMPQLARFPEIIKLSAEQFEAHHLAHYLRDLANLFHSYYNACTFIVEDQALRNARLTLIKAVQIVLASALALIGVQAPERM